MPLVADVAVKATNLEALYFYALLLFSSFLSLRSSLSLSLLLALSRAFFVLSIKNDDDDDDDRITGMLCCLFTGQNGRDERDKSSSRHSLTHVRDKHLHWVHSYYILLARLSCLPRFIYFCFFSHEWKKCRIKMSRRQSERGEISSV